MSVSFFIVNTRRRTHGFLFATNGSYLRPSTFYPLLLTVTLGQVDNFTDCCVRDPSMWYFYSSTLQVSTDIDDYGEGINGKLFGCLLLAWFLTYICIAKGIKTSGKVRKCIRDIYSAGLYC